VVMQVVVDLFI